MLLAMRSWRAAALLLLIGAVAVAQADSGTTCSKDTDCTRSGECCLLSSSQLTLPSTCGYDTSYTWCSSTANPNYGCVSDSDCKVSGQCCMKTYVSGASALLKNSQCAASSGASSTQWCSSGSNPNIKCTSSSACTSSGQCCVITTIPYNGANYVQSQQCGSSSSLTSYQSCMPAPTTTPSPTAAAARASYVTTAPTPTPTTQSPPSGGSTGDPIIAGFDNTKFSFTGLPFAYFNMLTEQDHQLTAFFTPAHLSDHEGTFVTEFGIMFGSDRIAVRVQPDGSLTVELNDKPVVMEEGEHKLELALSEEGRPQLGQLALTWDYFHPRYGHYVHIVTRLIDLELWSVPPGQMDRGGVPLPAYLDSHVGLLQPPAGDVMYGVLGETYNRLVQHLVQNVPLEAREFYVPAADKAAYQVQHLFDTGFSDNLFRSGGLLVKEKAVRSRQLIADVAPRSPVAFPIFSSTTGVDQPALLFPLRAASTGNFTR